MARSSRRGGQLAARGRERGGAGLRARRGVTYKTFPVKLSDQRGVETANDSIGRQCGQLWESSLVYCALGAWSWHRQCPMTAMSALRSSVRAMRRHSSLLFERVSATSRRGCCRMISLCTTSEKSYSTSRIWYTLTSPPRLLSVKGRAPPLVEVDARRCTHTHGHVSPLTVGKTASPPHRTF